MFIDEPQGGVLGQCFPISERTKTMDFQTLLAETLVKVVVGEVLRLFVKRIAEAFGKGRAATK